MKKQQGIVLFLALIVLLILTMIGVGLAMNSSQSLRMAGAGNERVSAMAAAQGAQAKVLNDLTSDVLALMTVETEVVDSDFKVNHKVTPISEGDVSCKRTEAANNASLIRCRRIEISSEASFGREDMGRLQIVVGVEQEVFTGG